MRRHDSACAAAHGLTLPESAYTLQVVRAWVRCMVEAEEAARSATVAEWDLTPDSLQSELQDILTLAAARWRAPTASFTVVEGDRQFFPARLGGDASQTPRRDAICACTVEERGLLLSPDTREDPRLRSHPAVVGSPFVRFYAGVPLRPDDDAPVIGALCVWDTRPHPDFDDGDINLLWDLSALLLQRLQQRPDRRRRGGLRTRPSVRGGDVLL